MRAVDTISPEPQSDSSGEGLLVTEAHHRIANNLALVAGSVKARASEIVAHDRLIRPSEVASLLEEISGRITTVGVLHRLLSRVGETGSIDLARYLDEVVTATIAALGAGDRIDLTWTSRGACNAPSDHALPIALIVAEVLTNTVKYAHPTGGVTKVWLGCTRRGDGSLMIDMSDDGIGLPDGFDPKSDGGLGLQTIRGLAVQLGAQMLFRSGPLGVGVTLVIAPRSGHFAPRMELVS